MTTKITLEEIRSSFLNFVDGCLASCCFSCSARLQKLKIDECDERLYSLHGYKSQAAQNGDEASANEFFLMQCKIRSLRSYLFMWLSIKEGEFQKGWCELIDAQDYLSVVLKLREYEGAMKFREHLFAAEMILFPGWKLFNSVGMAETIGDCSICDLKFSKCEHLEGRIYMGRLCQRVNREIKEIYHSALVENPRDRRCVITKVSNDDGVEIDWFTGERTGRTSDPNAGKRFEACVLHTGTLELD